MTPAVRLRQTGSSPRSCSCLLATTFADHKQGLEGQWHQGEEVATEDLRLALRQYRSFLRPPAHT